MGVRGSLGIAGAGLFVLMLLPSLAQAHAFGQVFTIALPFWQLGLGASIALIYSFIAFAIFSTPTSVPPRRPRILGRMSRAAILSFRIFGVAVFAATVVIGIYGSQEVTNNLAPLLFWVFLMLGVAYASIVVDGFWRLINPFEVAVRSALGRRHKVRIAYPQWLGYFPALFVYFCFIALELLSNGIGAVPFTVAVVLIAYVALSFVGAAVFGADDWFTYADFFNVFFGFIGHLAPIRVTNDAKIELSTSVYRVVSESPAHISALFFILFMLASTGFDGLRETQIWYDSLFSLPFAVEYLTLINYALLFVFPFVFFGFYAVAVYSMKILTGSTLSFRDLLLRFAYSLIPIALAYNIAHYFMLLVNGVQSGAALASDPLGYGWDLFHTAAYQVNIDLVGAQTVWSMQIIAIICGHVAATYIAHRIALREFVGARRSLIGQLPMLLLMVCYTVFGLWILSLGFV